MFGISRGSGDTGTLFRRLIPFRGHLKENFFLKIQGTKSTQQSQIDPIGHCGDHHRVERFSSIDMELNPRLKRDSLIPIRFPVWEMPEKATISIRTLTKSLDRQIDDGLSGNQEGRDGGGSHHHQSQGCSHK